MEKQLVKMLTSHKTFEQGKTYEIDGETATKWIAADLCEKANADSLIQQEIALLQTALDDRDAKLINKISSVVQSTAVKTPVAVKAVEDDYTFNDWFRAVKRAQVDQEPEAREYLRNKYYTNKTVQNVSSGVTGGYAVPTQFLPDLIRTKPEDYIVRSRARVINMSATTMKIPALDQSTNARGGMVAYYTDEVIASSITATNFNLQQLELSARDLNALIYVTQDMLDDAAFDVQSFVTDQFRDLLLAREDKEYLTGNGVSGPLGILNSGCALTTSSRTTSGHIKFEDIVNMESLLLPESRGRAVWVAHISTLPEIVYLKDAAGFLIYLQNATVGGYPTLRGMPIMFTGKTPALGSKADLMLCDMSYYYVGLRKEVTISFSEHVAFTQNQIAFKATMRHDGQAALASAVKLDDGTTSVSPFVLLHAN